MSEAVARRRATGEAGSTRARILSAGEGWQIVDVLCTCDSDDKVGEDRHSYLSIAMVLAGAFQYRGARGNANLTPGSLLFGAPGAEFTCRHEHGAGDRCLAVQFEPDAFELLQGALAPSSSSFPPLALPAHASTTALFSAAEAVAAEAALDPSFGEEAAYLLAERAFGFAWQLPRHAHSPDRRDAVRIGKVVRLIESEPAKPHRLADLAGQCGMSRFHFLRRFREVTGMTPYAFVRRARLREAGRLLLSSESSVLEVALEAGFSDLSTFHHAFRRAMGSTPRAYRLGGVKGALHG